MNDENTGAKKHRLKRKTEKRMKYKGKEGRNRAGQQEKHIHTFRPVSYFM
jgi:hypothetical protein